MEWTNNPEHDFVRWDAEQAEQEEKLPECDCCGERCYHKYFRCFGHIVCEECMDDMKVYVEDY